MTNLIQSRPREIYDDRISYMCVFDSGITGHFEFYKGDRDDIAELSEWAEAHGYSINDLKCLNSTDHDVGFFADLDPSFGWKGRFQFTDPAHAVAFKLRWCG